MNFESICKDIRENKDFLKVVRGEKSASVTNIDTVYGDLVLSITELDDGYNLDMKFVMSTDNYMDVCSNILEKFVEFIGVSGKINRKYASTTPFCSVRLKARERDIEKFVK